MPTPSRSRRRLRCAALLVLLAALQMAGVPSGWAQPRGIGVVAQGTIDGRSRLIVDMSGAPLPPPGSFSVAVDGGPRPTEAGPILSDRLAMALVVDASAGDLELQGGLSGLVDFALGTSQATRTALVADTTPPVVVTPLQPGPASMLAGLNGITPHGDRQTAIALGLAAGQLPREPDNPRLVVLYTAGPDAGGEAPDELVARLNADGIVLAVVSAAGDGGPVPPYWSAVAARTGGVAVGARASGVINAFGRLRAALLTRYLVTLPAPDRRPTPAVVGVATQGGTLTADTVIPAEAPRAGTGTGASPVVLLAAVVLGALVLVVGAFALFRVRKRTRPAMRASTQAEPRCGTRTEAQPPPRCPDSAETGATSGTPETSQTSTATTTTTTPASSAAAAKATTALASAKATSAGGNVTSGWHAWNIPARSEPVVERDPLLTAIGKAVRTGRPAVLQPADDQPGVGASTALVEFAHRNRDAYDIAWWIGAQDPQLVGDQMAQLAETLGLATSTDSAEQATAVLLDVLRKRNRWLLVFDDAGSRRDLARFLPAGPGHVVVGSTDPEWRKYATPVTVPPFTRVESARLLRARRAGLTEAEADRVAAALDERAVTVDPAGATLADTRMSVDSYLRLMSAHADADADVASTAWSVVFDRLAADDPAALTLLTLVAWLGQEPVPFALLTGHPEALPAVLGDLARDPELLAERAAILRRRALAHVVAESVRLHPVPAAHLVRSTADDHPGDAGWATWAVRLLRAAAPSNPADPAATPAWRRLLPHVLAATDPSRPLDEVAVDVGWLLQHAAGFLLARGEPGSARALLEDSYDLYRRRLGGDHPDTTAVARDLADVLRTLGRPDEAKRLPPPTAAPPS